LNNVRMNAALGEDKRKEGEEGGGKKGRGCLQLVPLVSSKLVATLLSTKKKKKTEKKWKKGGKGGEKDGGIF